MAEPAQLPDGLVSYKRTAVLDRKSVPAGLLGDHRTKQGVWGLIRVEEGDLLYRVTDPRRPASEQVLSAGDVPGVVEPTITHHVEVAGAVRFWVEFFKQGSPWYSCESSCNPGAPALQILACELYRSGGQAEGCNQPIRRACQDVASGRLREREDEDMSTRQRTGAVAERRALHPDTLMLNHGYDPSLSEGAVKPPVFLTSTFVFPTAEDGRDFFDYVAGRKDPPQGQARGLVYSRFNHPNGEIVEDRLAAYEGAQAAVVFSSGMSAITTSLLAHARPGDVILHSQPLYGGTETLLTRTLANLGIGAVGFEDGLNETIIQAAADRAISMGRVAVVLIETPANPTNSLVDISLLKRLCDAIGEQQRHRPLLMCDNTLLGPVFQRPLQHGADISLYSLTKYVGGHSDLVAGAAVGSAALMREIRLLRSAIGTQLDPHSCWMLGRSLETLGLRMERANANAASAAAFLQAHPKVERVSYLPFHPAGSAQAELFKAQCTGAGSTFSFDLIGGQPAAFRFLNALRIFKLAVSLGGTESLASHPASTTHSGVPAAGRERIGVGEGTVRLSIGIEHPGDIVADLASALDA